MSKKNRIIKKQKPVLDIIYPVYSNYETLDKSLQMLDKACGDLDYRIYLVDDFSPDYQTKGKEFYHYLRNNLNKLGGILIKDKNSGFADTCNKGFNLGSADQVMFISTDVLPLEDSVRIMTEHLIGSPELGITFPKLLFFPNSNDPNRPGNKVQAAGIVFDIRQEPYHIFSGWDADHPLVNRVKDMNACTGACFVIRRDIFRKVGGFDINCGRGTYEDVILSLLVRRLGYKIRYLPQAVMYHYVGMTSLLTNSPFPLKQNKEYMKLRYGNIIPYDDWLMAM